MLEKKVRKNVDKGKNVDGGGKMSKGKENVDRGGKTFKGEKNRWKRMKAARKLILTKMKLGKERSALEKLKNNENRDK